MCVKCIKKECKYYNNCCRTRPHKLEHYLNKRERDGSFESIEHWIRYFTKRIERHETILWNITKFDNTFNILCHSLVKEVILNDRE